MSSRESCRAVMRCTRAPKDMSFSVPSKLRFFVLPYAISDIRDRSCSTSSAGTPTAPSTRHTASGKTVGSRFASRIGMRIGSRDRSLTKISACRRPMCRTLPYQSPSRVVDRTDASSSNCFSRRSSRCVQRSTTMRWTAYLTRITERG